MKTPTALIAGVALLGLIGAGVWFMQRAPLPAPEPAPMQAVTPIAVTSAPAEAASVPSIVHPIETPEIAAPSPAATDAPTVLGGLFGAKSLAKFFQLGDFARRFVATVDNLGRAQASTSLWPLNPVPGKLTIKELDGVSVIGPDNGQRYTAYLLLIEDVEMRRLVDAYKQLYPLFQQAYEELGFPKGYFNDRLVAVIDELLDTPEISAPIKVRLPTMAGPTQLKHPWKFYVFDDAALQSLHAGQKILLRMGPVNERRVKIKLAEFRRLVASARKP